MSKLPVLSGEEVIKKLTKHGYQVVRQKGSHVRLRHINSRFKPITVPLHKTIKPGLLHQIIKDANLALNDFLNS
jgi:predicted RNA binding protein YcfA (HicA-like mRNA interferase family)